jgi:hypothetical protein
MHYKCSLGAYLMTLGASIDSSTAMLQLVASFTIVIYNHNIFMVQTTGLL